jgi:hypothetical protein
MKTTHRIIAGGATALALAAGLGLAAPLAASASEVDACHLDKKVSEIHGWDVNDKYNLMVYRDRARKDSHFNGVVAEGDLRAKPCSEPFAQETTFHYVAFKGSGYFVRKGDGGYRNWAFYGVWTRGTGANSNRVDFKAR